MDRDYGDRYRDLFETHWWWRARTEYIVETLRRYRPAAGWTTILDIGCGDGLFFGRLKEFGEVEGIEPSAELVSADNADRNRIYICSFDEHFTSGKQYSLILMLDVLEHLERPVAALRHAVELLEPDGTLVATVPAFKVLWTNHDVLNHHQTRYTKKSFRNLADGAGLDIEEERYLYHWTFPIKLGLGLAEQAFRLKTTLPKVSKGRWNEFLYRISRLEQMTLSRLRVPFGSSLLVVGKKKQADNPPLPR
ncbi:MAG TPA: class I SAM-dependent methyltransferase [Terriglobales bacterium]|nr:class I SAM-dependent methyltransferase [Terriglobales bacterium]